MSLSQRTITPEDKKKLETYEAAAIRVFQEIDDLRSGLKDTTSSLAEELGIKPKELTEAVRLVYKSKIQEKKETTTTVEEILHILGHI